LAATTTTKTTILAMTHVPSPNMNAAIRTHAEFQDIDLALAKTQHEAYRLALAKAGAEVRLLDVNREHPDAVFIEDTAIVLDEIAIITSMGAEARQAEPAGIEIELARYRTTMTRILPPATLEGGDVVCVGKMLFVGQTARTNRAGIDALARITEPFGYFVVGVPVEGCLHLKTACTALPNGALLINPACLPNLEPLRKIDRVEVDPSEPSGANVVVVGENVCMSDAYPRTADRIRQGGHAKEIHPVRLTEFAKADGCATCLSLVFSPSMPATTTTSK
jgi:dimethylargininase